MGLSGGRQAEPSGQLHTLVLKVGSQGFPRRSDLQRVKFPARGVLGARLPSSHFLGKRTGELKEGSLEGTSLRCFIPFLRPRANGLSRGAFSQDWGERQSGRSVPAPSRPPAGAMRLSARCRASTRTRSATQPPSLRRAQTPSADPAGVASARSWLSLGSNGN